MVLWTLRVRVEVLSTQTLPGCRLEALGLRAARALGVGRDLFQHPTLGRKADTHRQQPVKSWAGVSQPAWKLWESNGPVLAPHQVLALRVRACWEFIVEVPVPGVWTA